MAERWFGRIFDAMQSRRWSVLVVGLAVVCALAAPALQLPLDMSFRPFFADDDAAAAPTREFEQVFGPVDATHLGVVITHDRLDSPRFLRALQELGTQVRALPGVVEVVSLTHFPVPVEADGTVRGQLLLPPALYAESSADPAACARAVAHPAFTRTVRSADGRHTLLLARLQPAFRTHDDRLPTLAAVRALARPARVDGGRCRIVGAPVVESGYASMVTRGCLTSMALTSLGLIVVLWLLFRRVALVNLALAGVSLATPMTLGAMALMGGALTIVNSMVPTLVMVIGVADAIHMVRRFLQARAAHAPPRAAARAMFVAMALPCLLTTVTTALGFLALRTAEIAALREFGANVALGVSLVFLANLVVIPLVLAGLPATWTTPPNRRAGRLDRALAAWVGWVVARPRRVTVGSLALAAAACVWLPQLVVDQRFNEDVDPRHSLRADQALLESSFGGFLGPSIRVTRRDGGAVLDDDARTRLHRFAQAVQADPEVLRVDSPLDLLPGATADAPDHRLWALRHDPLLGWQARTSAGPDGRALALRVRTVDMGTVRAARFGERVEGLMDRELGPELQGALVGQWWLSQDGLSNLLGDMLRSFGTSALLVLPLLFCVVRRWRLFAVALPANLLPLLGALAFMAAAGISVRVGTAMVLAIALGVAVDDTIHVLVGLRRRVRAGDDAGAAITHTMREAGGGLLYSSLVLVGGFATMCTSELLTLRDMGLVAMVALGLALVVDCTLVPAAYVWMAGDRRRRPAPRRPASASVAGRRSRAGVP